MGFEYGDPAHNLTYGSQYGINMSYKLFPAYQLYFGLIPLPIAIVTTACTLAYTLSLSKEIAAKRVSRKCYTLILNRAVGDLLCCAFFLAGCFYLIFVPQEDFRLRILLIIGTFCGGCFWSVMVSYVSLSVLKLFAVYRPLIYKKVITIKRCIYLILLSWVIYALVIIYTLVMLGLSTMPRLKSWSGCDLETCGKAMVDSKNYLFIVLYIFTIAVFVATIIFVRKAHAQSDSLQKGSEGSARKRGRKRLSMWKLAVGVSTFAIFNFFYIVQIFARGDKGRYTWLEQEGVAYLGILWALLVVRILADDIIGFVTDCQIRRGALRLIGSKSESNQQNCRSRLQYSDGTSSFTVANEQRASV